MVPVAHGGSAVAFKAGVEGAYASPLTNEEFFAHGQRRRSQFVFMQNAEPGGLYCADETDGESLRACEQMNESLLGYEAGGTEVEPRLATAYESQRRPDRVDLHAARGRQVPRRLEPRRQRRRARATRSSGTRRSAPRGPGGRLHVLLRTVRRLPQPAAQPRTEIGGGACGRPRRRSDRCSASSFGGCSYRSRCCSGSSLFTFVLARVIPGDPCRAALGERATDADLRRRSTSARGSTSRSSRSSVATPATSPQGDLGDSVSQRRPVTTLLKERLPITLQLSHRGPPAGDARRHPARRDLGLPAQLEDRRGHDGGRERRRVHAGVLARPVAPVRVRGQVEGHAARAYRRRARSTPGSCRRRSTSSGGSARTGSSSSSRNIDMFNAVLIWRWDIFVNAGLHLILPAVALATIPMAIIARMTRSSLLDVLGLDYVRTARAKGLREFVVVVAPRAAQLAAPGGDHHRPVARVARRWRHPHRDDLQPHRRRQDPLRRDQRPRLHGGAGLHARHRDGVRLDQPARPTSSTRSSTRGSG